MTDTDRQPDRRDAEDGNGAHPDARTPKHEESRENRKGEVDERLDEALEETFPSSDPVSVKVTK